MWRRKDGRMKGSAIAANIIAGLLMMLALVIFAADLHQRKITPYDLTRWESVQAAFMLCSILGVCVSTFCLVSCFIRDCSECLEEYLDDKQAEKDADAEPEIMTDADALSDKRVEWAKMKLANAETLGCLFSRLRFVWYNLTYDERQRVDLKALPRFYPERPTAGDSESILSWDATHMIVSTMSGGFAMVPIGAYPDMI
jgi:hypothetical protein